MARVANRLTDRKIKTTKTAARLADGLGLYLIVEGEFSKNWVFEYQFNGKRRYMGLGSALARLIRQRAPERLASMV